MAAAISFYVTTIDGSARRRVRPEQIEGAVRTSLVTVAGSTYPGLESPARWRAEKGLFEPGGARFDFPSGGSATVSDDASFEATRHPLKHEEGPVLCLLDLAFEAAMCIRFAGKLREALGVGAGEARIGITLEGFANAPVDFGGARLSEALADRTDLPSLWRFKPPIPTLHASFDVTRSLPCEDPTASDAASDLIEQVAGLAWGRRHGPPGSAEEPVRLDLDGDHLRGALLQAVRASSPSTTPGTRRRT